MDKEYERENRYLEELAPHLFDPSVRQLTRSPSGYFDELEREMAAKIYARRDTENSIRSPRSVWFHPRNWALAAAVAVVLALVPWFFDQNQEAIEDPIAQAAELLREAPLDYPAEFATSINEELLFGMVDVDELAGNFTPRDMTDEQLIGYLLEEGITIEMIQSANRENFKPKSIEQ